MEGQTTQWPKERGQRDKQWSTKHTHKTKDRVTRTPLKTGGERICSRRINSSCSTSGTRRVNLVTTHIRCGVMKKLFCISQKSIENNIKLLPWTSKAVNAREFVFPENFTTYYLHVPRLTRRDQVVKSFEYTKWVIRICKWKDRQHNGQREEDKGTNNDLQNIHIKLKIE
jgi:hypothetical protein